MDILNELPEAKYAEVDDLLAFISIYDDENRTRAYFEMLGRHRDRIADAVVVDAGCGFGIFSEQLAQMGARKVYAVEANPALFDLARQRLQNYPQVELVRADIRTFVPDQEVDILLHEFFGQLLYDEDVSALQELRFAPALFLPDRAVLMGGCVSSAQLVDDTVTPAVLEKLQGVLISGLFDEEKLDLQFPVIEWCPNQSNHTAVCDISAFAGDLLYFGLQIYQGDTLICQAGECSNWSFVWTPRVADRFELSFAAADRGMAVHFRWLTG